MSTNADDIIQLQLNDTFYDWYLKTNQIIDYINPINVYDVFPGEGLVESRSGSPGTVELSVSTNSALYGIGTLNTGAVFDVVLKYADMTEESVVNTSLFSFQGEGNQLYKVQASNILPPVINGDHTFNGDITLDNVDILGPTITLNAGGLSTNRDNCGIIVESLADTEIQNVLWTYDEETTAWMSSENLGIKAGKFFVSDSYPKAIFPFNALSTQGIVDVQLGTTSGGIPERFSMEAAFDTENSITFSHHYNNVLVNDILELSSSGGGSQVIVKDTITITDVLNSTPFTQTPEAISVPVTDSDGYLTAFVNRVILPVGGTVVVGDFVYVHGSGIAVQAHPNDIVTSQSIGIVESITTGNAVIILTGVFEGLLSGLVTGDKYYLDPVTPGEVTNVDPGNTQGEFDKPVFIATSTTSGIIIPDFTFTGSSTVVSSGNGTASDAWNTILVNGTSVVAEGEDIVEFIAGTNITVTGDDGADTVTFACKIPESATNHTLLSGTGSATYAYTAAIDTFSIVGRAVNGNIAGIVIAPGTIVGRIDDSNDSDNEVKGLTGTEVRNIIGLPENSSYIQTVSFETGSGVPVLVHDATSDGETLTISAGSNITFSYSGGTLFINGESGGGGGGGGSTDGSTILVGLERENPVVLTELLFENDFGGANTARDQFIEFEFRDNLGGTGFVSAKPTNNYFQLAGDNASSSHTAGNILQLQGGSSGLEVKLTTGTGHETFTIDLNNTIYVQKIIASPLSTDKNGLILSGGDDSGRNTVKILDETRPTAALPGVNQSTLIINAWDSVQDVNELRRSTRSLSGIYATKCVSMFADSGYDDGSTGPSLYSYPIRMHELIVDKIICANLEAEEATKVNETINKIMGGINDTGYFIGVGSTKLEFITNAVDYDSNGILFEFTDSEDGVTTKNAFIFSPTKDYASTIDIADYRQFVVGGSLRFAEVITDTGEYTNWSPTLSHGSTSGLLCESYQTSSAQLQFDANSTGTATVGVQTNAAAAGAYTYLTHTHGATTSHLRIAANSELQATSFTVKTSSNVGYKFEPTDIGQNNITAGHVMYIDSVATNIGTVKSRFIIKPLGGGPDVSDPINTLYYVV